MQDSGFWIEHLVNKEADFTFIEWNLVIMLPQYTPQSLESKSFWVPAQKNLGWYDLGVTKKKKKRKKMHKL